ncbi:Ig-like domain-containing protein [Marinobacter sp. DS40M6]|uniref:Ig-like domain-containing protein n=1 Tax=Marinobacter sp. DS40M6 TaxID=1597776 RepID=UPI002358BE67|nr:Ig-like domain-containing protein [Marinobacter sp. DS40M6]MDC8457806.1 hypothetical protein [Marinobacter sp. DS40M6]
MSLVKGTGGFLDIAANLIPDGTYTIAVWYKTANAAGFESFFYYANTASNTVRIDNWGGKIRHRVDQAFGSGAEEDAGSVANTWQCVIGSMSVSDGVPRLVTDSAAVDAGGGTGAFQTPASPALRIFGRLDGGNQPANGGKFGMAAIYPAKVDATDEAHIVGGGNPDLLPSETSPIALWIDVAGLAVDGSDNVTSWTDQVGGLVLTPSGTVTADTDFAPVTYPTDTPTISNVDGDNAVNQGQLVNINVTDFTESITSGDIGGVAFPSIPDNDPADDVIQVRMPVTLAAGTYDVTISGATETDTISGVTYAITHQYTAPYAPVDSNSLFAGQSLTEDSYFRIVTPPANGTIDAATAEADSLWGNDVDDIYTPDEGFTGDDTVTLEILYADGTTAQWTATITVEEQIDTDPDAFTVDPLTNQALDQWVEFDPILVSGIDPGEQIAVVVSGTYVQYAVDSGSGYGGFSATSTNVQAGDLVKPRIRTIDDFSSEATGSISIGSESSSLSATTRAAVLPVLDTPVPNLNLGEEDVVSLDLDDYFSGASSYSLSGIPAGSGLSFTGSVLSGETNKNDVEASPYNLTATAFSADGSIQDVFEVTVVDDIAPTISIGAINTMDTTPTASGSAGDSDSLTLDLDGVDVTHTSSYNITPSGGSWSQQFPELAIGTYNMTLTGVDTAGNETVETATLQIVEPSTSPSSKLLRQLLRGSLRSSLKLS